MLDHNRNARAVRGSGRQAPAQSLPREVDPIGGKKPPRGGDPNLTVGASHGALAPQGADRGGKYIVPRFSFCVLSKCVLTYLYERNKKRQTNKFRSCGEGQAISQKRPIL